MSQENSVKIWAGCAYSLNFGWFGDDEAGAELRSEGINENYACEHPIIVNGGNYKTFPLNEYPKLTNVAVLHGSGRFDDPKVIEALRKSCGKCLYFKKRTS